MRVSIREVSVKFPKAVEEIDLVAGEYIAGIEHNGPNYGGWTVYIAASGGADPMSAELPAVLRDIAPEVGSMWIWEPLKGDARCTVVVTDVTWNGEECWVGSERIDALVQQVWVRSGEHYPNDLSRWVEATVLLWPADEATKLLRPITPISSATARPDTSA